MEIVVEHSVPQAQQATEIQVRFIPRRNKEADVEPIVTNVPDTYFAVPLKLNRAGLSEIVNHLAGNNPPRPFDFLCEGEFITSTLALFLQRRGLSSEQPLTLEYVEALPPPQSQPSSPHPDWIGSIDISNDVVLTGCYDGALRLFNAETMSNVSDAIATVAAHSSAIKSVRVFSRSGSTLEFVSASKDHTLRTWSWSEGGAPLCTGIAHAHTNSVDAIATKNRMFASGSWDRNIILWSLPDSTTVHSASSKKRKAVEQSSATTQQLAAAVSLEGHKGAVSGLCWPDEAALYSCSWDHTLKMWDTESARCVVTWNSDAVATAIDFSEGANLIASAHSDGAVRVWDPRVKTEKEKSSLQLVLKSHRAWANAVAWCPASPHMLASAAHDGNVKLWDVRARVPLHTIAAHTDKALCVTWARLPRGHAKAGDWVVSGGADNKVSWAAVDLSGRP